VETPKQIHPKRGCVNKLNPAEKMDIKRQTAKLIVKCMALSTGIISIFILYIFFLNKNIWIFRGD
jgi:hypothetical protein